MKRLPRWIRFINKLAADEKIQAMHKDNRERRAALRDYRRMLAKLANKNGVLKPFRKVIHLVAMGAPKVANVPNVHKIDDRDVVRDIDKDFSPKAINQRINSCKNKKDLDNLLDSLDALGCDYDFLDDKINKKYRELAGYRVNRI
nr:MAG TPA: hypothetical protein [Caudoviricetes sp.]